MDTYPTRAHLSGKEKRYQPIKHYVFIVEVTWSDDSLIPIYRQYSDFAQLHNNVLEQIEALPVEQRNDVTIPQFPKAKRFDWQENKKNATVRRHALDDYCMALFRLDDVISKHKMVVEFFRCRDGDINPDSNKQRNSTGKQNRRPSSIIDTITDLFSSKSHSKSSNDAEKEDTMVISSPIVCETYLVMADYKAEEKGEIGLSEGMAVEVVEKYDNGWWFIQTEDQFGWAPATYLSQEGECQSEEPAPLATGVHKYITIEAYSSEQLDEVSFAVGVLVKVLHKLLDGWWIIDYKGKVGYAPAAYLVPFNNPHYKGTVKYGKSKKRPTKRRISIKNGKGEHLRERGKRDLSIYKKMSKKLSEEEAKKRAERILARISEENVQQILQKSPTSGTNEMHSDVTHESAEKALERVMEDLDEDEHTYVNQNSYDSESEAVRRIEDDMSAEGKISKCNSLEALNPEDSTAETSPVEPLQTSNKSGSGSLLRSRNKPVKKGSASDRLSCDTGIVYNKAPPSPRALRNSRPVSADVFIWKDDPPETVNASKSAPEKNGERHSSHQNNQGQGLNNNNNDDKGDRTMVTVHDVVTTLVNALRSKTVSCVRTNDVGELVVTFTQNTDGADAGVKRDAGVSFV